jgi:hypothetical protein
MKKLSWLLLFVYATTALANYDAKPVSTAKGGTGSTSQSANVVVTTNGSGNIVSTSSTTATEIGYVHGLTSSIQTQIGTLLPLAGGTMTGAINFGGFTGTNGGTPINPTDIVNKSYVDASINGLSWHTAVLVATTANITLSGEQTIDGVLTSGSRVLVKNQTTTSANGIYTSGSGSWTRSADMNAWSQIPGAAVFVQSGTVNGDLGFVSTSVTGGTLGSTAVTFVQFSSAGAYTADGSTLQLVSGVFSVKALGIANAQIATAAAIAYSKLALSNSILASDMASGAATSTQAYFANGSGGVSIRSIVGGDIPTLNQNTTGSAGSLSSTLIVGQGGTGQTSLTAHGVVIGEGASAVAVTSVGTTGQVLTGNTGADPTWQTPAAGFSNPMTTLGDIMFENATPAAARLAGNTTSGKQFLTQTGTGAVSAAPAWGALASGDIPNNAANTSGSAASLSATLIVGQGGTGFATTTAYGVILGGTTSTGAFQNAGTGTTGQVLTSAGASAVPTWQTPAAVNMTVVAGPDTAYTILTSGQHVRATVTAVRVYTLPVCNAGNIGERHEVKNLPASTANITLQGNGGTDTIDGGTTYTLTPGDSAPVVCGAFSSVGAWDVQ